jgi:hypothetical protein
LHSHNQFIEQISEEKSHFVVYEYGKLLLFSVIENLEFMHVVCGYFLLYSCAFGCHEIMRIYACYSTTFF